MLELLLQRRPSLCRDPWTYPGQGHLSRLYFKLVLRMLGDGGRTLPDTSTSVSWNFVWEVSAAPFQDITLRTRLSTMRG